MKFSKKLKIKDIVSMVDFSEKRVLDAGCGTGLYSKLAKEKGASEVIAVDFASPAVKLTIQNSKDIHGVIASISNLPFRTGIFDVVMCISVLYHITDDILWETAISELSRVLKPGGTLLVQIEKREDFMFSETYRGRPFKLYMEKFKENDLKFMNVENVFMPPKNKLLRLLLNTIPVLSKLLIRKRSENVLICLKKI